MRSLANERFGDDGSLEDKITNALQQKGLITRKSATMKVQKIIWQVAASVALLVAGYFFGKQVAGPAGDTSSGQRQQYALFLYENEEFKVADGNTLVAEYTSWAQQLAEAGQLAYAEKLNDTDTWLGSNSVQNHTSKLTGYFVFYAKDRAEAEQIARTHPHTSYGGGLELRAIDKID